jgi:hypothetical protein
MMKITGKQHKIHAGPTVLMLKIDFFSPVDVLARWRIVRSFSILRLRRCQPYYGLGLKGFSSMPVTGTNLLMFMSNRMKKWPNSGSILYGYKTAADSAVLRSANFTGSW